MRWLGWEFGRLWCFEGSVEVLVYILGFCYVFLCVDELWLYGGIYLLAELRSLGGLMHMIGESMIYFCFEDRSTGLRFWYVCRLSISGMVSVPGEPGTPGFCFLVVVHLASSKCYLHPPLFIALRDLGFAFDFHFQFATV